MLKIMFVCTGNICRSAMANGYMQYVINKKLNSKDYLISSCGTYGITGQQATNYAILAMKEYNVNLENHRAKNIKDVDIENYDIILCMTKLQKQCVQDMYSKISSKVFTLKEYLNNEVSYLDIDDPWGLSEEVYKECAKEIVENIDKLVIKIK